jgi:UDP-glucose 4-epimerase
MVLDNLSSGSMRNLERWGDDPSFRFIRGDVRRPLDLSLRPQDLSDTPISTIIHLAARVDVTTSFEKVQEDLEVNYLGTLNVLEYALRWDIRNMVYTSSAAVYGDTKCVPVSEDDETVPLSPYGLNKLSSENLLRIYSAQYGLSCKSLRLFNVYGPRQSPSNPYSGVISKFISWALSSQPMLIYGDGGQTRDFVNVADVASAIYSAASRSDPGTFNIGTGRETSVSQLAKEVASAAGTDLRTLNMPERKGEILRSCANVTLASKRLSWEPAIELREGLRSTLRWFQLEGTRARTSVP